MSITDKARRKVQENMKARKESMTQNIMNDIAKLLGWAQKNDYNVFFWRYDNKKRPERRFEVHLRPRNDGNAGEYLELGKNWEAAAAKINKKASIGSV